MAPLLSPVSVLACPAAELSTTASTASRRLERVVLDLDGVCTCLQSPEMETTVAPGDLCDFARLIPGRAPFEECLEGPTESPSGLEEMAVRTFPGAKRPKFLMFERGNLRLPSEFEKFQWSDGERQAICSQP